MQAVSGSAQEDEEEEEEVKGVTKSRKESDWWIQLYTYIQAVMQRLSR